MPRYSEDADSPFRAAGAKPGLEIWCIEKLRLAPVPKSLHDSFAQNGPPQHDIHYWLGKDAKEGTWMVNHTKPACYHAVSVKEEFLQIDPLGEKLPLETSIYVIAEGQEPPYFTHFFQWDRSKANMHGNSFERKLAILKGNKQNLEAPVRSSWKASSREITPDSFRSKSLASNGRRSSSSPAPNVSVSSFNSSKNHLHESPTPIARKLFTSSPYNGNASNGRSFDSPAVPDPSPPSQNADLVLVEGIDANISSLIYPYERLKVDSSDPAAGINVTKREAYLSDEEFEEKFGMARRAFYELPKWKQNKLKMSIFLF